MSFTFEMDIGKGVLAIGIYNFIRVNQIDIGVAVLIYIAMQPRSHECSPASRCKYMYTNICAKQNDIGGAVLIYIAMQPRS